MNYYPFHIGDYAAHTRNLSLLEDLAYRRLLDAYYLAERPFNGCASDVAREIGMREHEAEVSYVLGKFFEREGDQWRNKRADAEIARFSTKIEQASRAGKASAERRLNGRSTGVEKSPTDVQPTNNQEPITNTEAIASVGAKRATRKAPPDFSVTPELQGWAAEHAPLIDLQVETSKFKDHTFSTARTDWAGTWRNWMRKAQQDVAARGPRHAVGFVGKGAAIAAQNARAVEEFLGETAQ